MNYNITDWRMTFFSRGFTQLFFKPISLYTRVAVGVGLQNDRRDSWPQRLPKRMFYGNIIPRNRWSSDQVPLQDRKVKKTVDFKGTKRVHIKTQKSDFARRFCTFQLTVRAENPQTMPLIIIFKGKPSPSLFCFVSACWTSKKIQNYSEFVISAWNTIPKFVITVKNR